jgi:hypothetical protein
VIGSQAVSVCPFWVAAGPIILLWFPSHPAQGLVGDGHVLASCEDCSVKRWNHHDFSAPSACHRLHCCIFRNLLLLGKNAYILASTSLALNCHFFKWRVNLLWFIPLLYIPKRIQLMSVKCNTWYIWYDIYLLQLGFHPVAVVGRIVQNWKEAAQKEKQYTKKKYKITEYTK